jgi:DinB family protein
MNREEIFSSLRKNHDTFTEYMKSLSEDEFTFCLNDEKWTAGQEMVHIITSVNRLANALMMPKFVIKMKFGVTNRPSRTYDALVEKYTAKLKEIGSSYQVQLDPVPWVQRQPLMEKLQRSVETLCHRARKYSEDELDYYILPHPLLGKMTMRELLYFTAHHVLHHKENSIRNLNSVKETL